MSEVLMFNPKDLAYFFISSGEAAKIDKMKNDGFVQNPRLVAMYHPEYKKHVMVQVQDQRTWEQKGYFAEPTIIYSPKEETRMVSSSDAKKALNNGWYASPAHFPGNDEGIVTPNISKEAV